jgi:hypothetical protein
VKRGIHIKEHLRSIGVLPIYEPWHERDPEWKRRTSYPIISGDAFRKISHIRVETPKQLAMIVDDGPWLDDDEVMIFAKGDIGCLVASAIDPEVASKCSLFIGNSDYTPSLELERFAEKFKLVCASNWLDSKGNVKPLPLGIGNSSRYGRRYVGRFLDSFRNLEKLRSSDHRSIDLLIAFTDSTNLVERSLARQAAQSFPGTKEFLSAVNQQIYFDKLVQSLFVLSPQGNGIDCYRTWESIYAGAIPIVLKRNWAFDDYQLPVLAVDDWTSGLQIVGEQPQGLYMDIMTNSPGSAHFDHIWSFLRRDT